MKLNESIQKATSGNVVGVQMNFSKIRRKNISFYMLSFVKTFITVRNFNNDKSWSYSMLEIFTMEKNFKNKEKNNEKNKWKIYEMFI